LNGAVEVSPYRVLLSGRCLPGEEKFPPVGVPEVERAPEISKRLVVTGTEQLPALLAGGLDVLLEPTEHADGLIQIAEGARAEPDVVSGAKVAKDVQPSAQAGRQIQ
jgi:hypothetical protein